MKSIDLPYIAHIPFQVISDKDLQPMAKIHFGCIAGLSVKEGYCWATDKQFAEMHGVGESTVTRWHRELEKKGFIKRITKNRSYRDEKGRMLWKKERKIYVNGGFSSKVFDTGKNDPIIDTGKNDPIDDTGKNACYKESISKDSIKKTTTEAYVHKSKDEPLVVVFSSLKKLDITDLLRDEITSKYSESDVDLAVSRTLEWKGRANDTVGIRTALKNKDNWSDISSSKDVMDQNRDYLKEKLIPYDGNTLGPFKVTVGDTYIEFSSASQCAPIMFIINHKDFIQNVEGFIRKINNIKNGY